MSTPPEPINSVRVGPVGFPWRSVNLGSQAGAWEPGHTPPTNRGDDLGHFNIPGTGASRIRRFVALGKIGNLARSCRHAGRGGSRGRLGARPPIQHPHGERRRTRDPPRVSAGLLAGHDGCRRASDCRLRAGNRPKLAKSAARRLFHRGRGLFVLVRAGRRPAGRVAADRAAHGVRLRPCRPLRHDGLSGRHDATNRVRRLPVEHPAPAVWPGDGRARAGGPVRPVAAHGQPRHAHCAERLPVDRRLVSGRQSLGGSPAEDGRNPAARRRACRLYFHASDSPQDLAGCRRRSVRERPLDGADGRSGAVPRGVGFGDSGNRPLLVLPEGANAGAGGRGAKGN